MHKYKATHAVDRGEEVTSRCILRLGLSYELISLVKELEKDKDGEMVKCA